MSPVVNPTSISSPSVSPLRWTQAPPIVRLWAFWFTVFTLFICGGTMLWGVTQFATSPNTGVVLTGGGLLLSIFFGAHLVALRRGWPAGWKLQLIWAGVFLGAIALFAALRMGFAPGAVMPTRDKVLLALVVVPSLVHLWIVAHWFKIEVKLWFGRLAKT
ncbi:hypothetical protein IAD21_04767 [Abditibacteriota bacterium]|nr:hypothetical protein IAD21_04767 [Abditibacteriota bacterium]